MDATEKHYIAHIRNADGCEQTVNQHNDNVSVLAQQSGALYGIGKLSAFTGRHHDDGKDTTEYLEYIKAAAAGKNVARGSVIHSTYGALLADQMVQSGDRFSRLTSEMVRTAIMSHHGLRDCISMDGVCSFSKAAERIADSYEKVRSIVYEQYGKAAIDDEYMLACILYP